MKRLVKALATRQPTAIPREQGTGNSEVSLGYATGAVTLFGLCVTQRATSGGLLGPGSLGRRQLKVHRSRQQAKVATGKELQSKNSRDRPRAPEYSAERGQCVSARKTCSWERTSAETRESCLKLTQGPSACSHQPDWKIYHSQGGGEQSEENRASAASTTSPGLSRALPRARPSNHKGET